MNNFDEILGANGGKKGNLLLQKSVRKMEGDGGISACTKAGVIQKNEKFLSADCGQFVADAKANANGNFAGASGTGVAYGGQQRNEALPYYILSGDKNACKFVTFCDKIGSTMRDITYGARGTMLDITKGKTNKNKEKDDDLCVKNGVATCAEKTDRKRKNAKQNSDNLNPQAEKLCGRAEESLAGCETVAEENLVSGETVKRESLAGGGGRKSVNQNPQVEKSCGSTEENLTGVGAVARENLVGSESVERENFAGGENLKGKPLSVGGVAKVSASERARVEQIARRRIQKMRELERGVHPHSTERLVGVLTDAEREAVRSRFRRFGLGAKRVRATDSVCGGIFCSSDENLSAKNYNEIYENDAENSKIDGKNAKIDEKSAKFSKNINNFAENYDKNLNFYDENAENFDKSAENFDENVKNFDNNADFGSGYEQVSRCFCASNNSAYGDDDSYDRGELISYGKLIFDTGASGYGDEDTDAKSPNKGQNENASFNGCGQSNAQKTEKAEQAKTDGVNNFGVNVDLGGLQNKVSSNFNLAESDLQQNESGGNNGGGASCGANKKQNYQNRRAYIVDAGDTNDCFPAMTRADGARRMVLDASMVGLDEEFIPLEVKNCELLNMRLDKRDVKVWGEKEWMKFCIKVDPCLSMCIDYCDRLVEKMSVLGGNSCECMAFGSAENMFNEIIDLIERKKLYIRLKKFVNRLKKELEPIDLKIIAYFVFGENTKDELLQVMSRRTVYRRANKVVQKLANFCIARGYTASWLYSKFGEIV